MRIRNTSRRALMLGAVIGLTIAGMSEPASAHAFDYPIPYRGRVEMRDFHTKIRVCDTSADGVGVSVEFGERHGNVTDYYTIGDANGSQPGCGVHNVSTGGVITRFNGHASTGADTGWVQA